MKSIFFTFLFFPTLLHAQVPGEWVWKGGSSAVNALAQYGTKGVPSSANYPPGLYEACEWTDKQGNFWLYGGWQVGYIGYTDDMWKFNPNTNEWTWVFGHRSGNQKPVYGTHGIPSTTNTPGQRSACYSWVDNNGDFWLYGGFSYHSPGISVNYSDLWKYNLAANMWTWMKGDTGVPSAFTWHYGTKGIESIDNRPAQTNETGVCWTGSDNDLWLLDNAGCLWRYMIATNNWIWMKGTPADTSNPYPSPIYGLKGVFDNNNSPGSNFFDYARWKDSKGNLWYLNGQQMLLWEYDVARNMWAWIDGDTITAMKYYGGEKCIKEEDAINPYVRKEARACWIDNCDNLWVMGGYGEITSNDLIYFDMANKYWVWADNDTTELANSIFGTKNISAPTNRPSSRTGALPFKDFSGNLWLFGGLNVPQNGAYADLWMYSIDTACTKCHIVAGLQTQSANHPSIYPNPCQNMLTIKSSFPISTISVTNLIGQRVYNHEYNTDKIQVDVSTFPAGVYFIRINETEVRKFVKE